MGCMLKGRKTSGELWASKTPVKSGGFTPTMVIGVNSLDLLADHIWSSG